MSSSLCFFRDVRALQRSRDEARLLRTDDRSAFATLAASRVEREVVELFEEPSPDVGHEPTFALFSLYLHPRIRFAALIERAPGTGRIAAIPA